MTQQVNSSEALRQSSASLEAASSRFNQYRTLSHAATLFTKSASIKSDHLSIDSLSHLLRKILLLSLQNGLTRHYAQNKLDFLIRSTSKSRGIPQVGITSVDQWQMRANTSTTVTSYVFVDRLKAMAKKNNVISVISECLRGTALMWYSTELTDLERDLLEESSLNQWYSALIGQAGTPDQRTQLVLRVMPCEAVR